MFFFFFTVKQATAAIVERFGKFDRIAGPGLHFKLPVESVTARVSLRVQQLSVNVETKTADDVFVRVAVAVQYFVMPDKVKEAFYLLQNPAIQIEAYVYDEVRATVPRMPLDEVFQNKDKIAVAVSDGLSEVMSQYGYSIVKALVNDIDPDAKVKVAMNEINAAQRMRRAAEEKGEAEKILRVKQAEAEAESKILQGKGIAGQRAAIVNGLRDSVEEFQRGVPGVTANDVMQLVLMTQYFDTLKELGQSSNTNTIMVPHTPGAVASFSEQIQNALIAGNRVADVAQDSGAAAPHPRREDAFDRIVRESGQGSAATPAPQAPPPPPPHGGGAPGLGKLFRRN